MVSSPQFIVQQRQGHNQYFEEFIAEGVLPLRMMQIPTGSFLMGSPEYESERSPSESPQHEVALSHFFLAKHPVTQAQWRAVAVLPLVNLELKANPSNFKGDNLPVEQVSWYEAVEFCDRLTLHTNRQYSLPTEAQWEHACRAGTITPFHFGETITTDLANYRGTDNQESKWSGSYGDGPKGKYREKTTAVNNFDASNAYGLCDMHGNVWEWCQDHWHRNYEGAPNDGSAWLTDNEKVDRVVRGGSWFYSPGDSRSANRYYISPVNRGASFGFRVSCISPKTPS
jgi:formylglycine-generating enzyme required for sulfatase activity